jgi:diaminopimelate epimerase
MHGCGNDFVIVDGPVELTVARVRELCDRRCRIGADGVLVMGAARGRCWPVMIHNADGSSGESCGNGARCVARYLLDRHGADELELSFPDGDVKARREGTVIAVTFASPGSPAAGRGRRHACVSRELRQSAGGLVRRGPANADLPALAAGARAAAGEANVEVARVVEPDLILLRVDERGVGETLACGTARARPSRRR